MSTNPPSNLATCSQHTHILQDIFKYLKILLKVPYEPGYSQQEKLTLISSYKDIIKSLEQTWASLTNINTYKILNQQNLDLYFHKEVIGSFQNKQTSLCNEILTIINTIFEFPENSNKFWIYTNHEYHVLYQTIFGKYNSICAEFNWENVQVKQKFVCEGSEAYESGLHIARFYLKPVNLLRLELEFNHSIFIFEILNNCKQAYKLLKDLRKILIVNNCQKDDASLDEIYRKVNCSMVKYASELDKLKKSILISNKSGELKQYSIDGKLQKDYKKVHTTSINSMALYKQYMFTCDCQGNIKQFSIPNTKIVKTYPKIHKKSIICLEIFYDQIFVACEDGIIIIWSISQMKIVNQKIQVTKNQIYSIKILDDSLFVIDSSGSLKMFEIKYSSLDKESLKPGSLISLKPNPSEYYGKSKMTCCKDQKQIFVTNYEDHLEKYRLVDNQLLKIKEYGKVHDCIISSIISSRNYVFTADFFGGLKQFCIKTDQLVKDYGNVYDVAIPAMMISGNFLMLPDGYGNLKQINVKRRVLLKDYGRVSNHVTDLVVS